MHTATTIAWNVSYARRDGGGIRIDAFLDALRRLDVEVSKVGIGAPSVEASAQATTSRLGDMKRRLLPVPLRSRAMRGVDAPRTDAIISLVSASHDYSLDLGLPCWIDYPDLWSEYASNVPDDETLLVKTTSRLQAKLWERRENREAAAATVVTTASWADSRTVPNAVWLPNPTFHGSFPARSAPSGPQTFGMLANFDYPPNRSAYKTLLEEWIPSLPKDAPPVVVAGFGSENLSSHPRVKLLGTVGRVQEFYDAIDVVLAPVDRGGGMKVKVVEALTYGLPVLASRHALEGFPPEISSACQIWDGTHTRYPANEDPRTTSATALALDNFREETFFTRVADLWSRLELSATRPS
jgi:hypothetical protein